jgi:thermostable 8-oxoguanine DNA glycosylase
MTIYKQIIELLKDDVGRTVSPSEIIKALKLKHGTKASSIILSDFCYNRINDGIKFDKHIFQYFDHNKYKFLSENYPFTGLIIHKPKGAKNEFIVGEWILGRKIIYKTPIDKNSKQATVIIDSVLRLNSLLNNFQILDTKSIKPEETNQPLPLFQSKSQIHELISRADDNDETKRLIAKFNELKKIRVPFYLNMQEFDEILHWKLRRQYQRQVKNIKRNTKKLIKNVTQSTFSIENANENHEIVLRLKTLIKLHGVQIPVASAIMTLCYPDKYCVIDFRGWRQIFGGGKEKTNYTIKEYIKYMSIIKKTALEFDVTPQEVDMAIWQYDIENHGKA